MWPWLSENLATLVGALAVAAVLALVAWKIVRDHRRHKGW